MDDNMDEHRSGGMSGHDGASSQGTQGAGMQSGGMQSGSMMAGSGSGGDQMTDEKRDLISASKVKGTTVYDSSGERIGTVDDLMITKQSGEVAYAVMSIGGFLGIGEKYHPLPWDTLDYDTDLGGYRVGGTGESLRDAPSFSRDEFDRNDWSSSTDSYYDNASSNGSIKRRGLSRLFGDGSAKTIHHGGTAGVLSGGGSADVISDDESGRTGTMTGGGMVGGYRSGGASADRLESQAGAKDPQSGDFDAGTDDRFQRS